MTQRRCRAALVLIALAGVAAPVGAQEPPDTVQVAPVPVPDSAGAADTLPVPDSLAPDTIFYNVPRSYRRVPTGFATGVWEWDRHAIMASGANTLQELVQEVPGVVTLAGGDYGTPASMSAFGTGGAGYRILRDGFEVYAVEGGVVDLQLIGLVGIDRVRMDRSMGQMVVEMWTHEYEDGRPFSVVEAGTGDLDTNMFRGIYADPTALGGSLGVGLERIDTRGRRRTDSAEEGGNRTGSWVRYQYHRGDRFGLGVDLRRMTAQTKVDTYAPTSERSDLTVRMGLRVRDGVVVNGWAGRSTYSVENPEADPFDLRGGTRRQVGGSVDLERGGLWLTGSYRAFDGGLPAERIDASGGFSHVRWGGLSGRYGRGSWNGEGTENRMARAWLTPIPMITLFGSLEDGRFGSRAQAALEGEGPPPVTPAEIIPGPSAITDRTTARGGGALSWGGATIAGAALYAWSDSLLPLGTSLDFGAPRLAGVHRNGYEGSLVLPTFWTGLTLQGSYQWWDEAGPYLPDEIYRGSFEYHRVFKETENLEVWASLGVRGHNPMLTLVADDGSGSGGAVLVPFYQSWYARVQVRVVTVRLWIGMDNFTLRRNLQNYPDRTLPYARSFFALRWDLWN